MTGLGVHDVPSSSAAASLAQASSSSSSSVAVASSSATSRLAHAQKPFRMPSGLPPSIGIEYFETPAFDVAHFLDNLSRECLASVNVTTQLSTTVPINTASPLPPFPAAAVSSSASSLSKAASTSSSSSSSSSFSRNSAGQPHQSTSLPCDLFETDEHFGEVFDEAGIPLQVLAVELERQLNEAKEESALRDAEHQVQLSEISRIFRGNVDRFKRLQRRIGAVSASAVKIGEKLEAVDDQRNRANEARELIHYFSLLNRSSSRSELPDLASLQAADDTLFSLPSARSASKSTELRDRAVLIQRLTVLWQDLSADGTSQIGQKRVEEIRNKLREQLLQQFEEAALNRDVTEMRYYAETLSGLRDTDECVSIYLSTLDPFVRCEALPPVMIQSAQRDYESLATTSISLTSMGLGNTSDTDSLTRSSSYHTLPRSFSDLDLPSLQPRTRLYHSDPELVEFYNVTVSIAQQECRIISKVFTTRSMVTKKFIQCVFRRLGTMLSKRLKPIKDQQSFQYLNEVAKMMELATDLCESCESETTIGPDTAILSAGLFETHQDAYLHNELAALNHLYASTFGATDVVDPEQKQVNKKKPHLVVSGLDNSALALSLSSLAEIVACFQANRDALTRCCIISTPKVRASNLQQIFTNFVQRFGRQFLIRSLSAIVEAITSEPSKKKYWKETATLAERFLEMTLQSNQVVILLQQHYHCDLLERLGQDAINERTYCHVQKESVVQALEETVARGVSRILLWTVNMTAELLSSNQKKHDFKLKDSAAWNPEHPTEACSATLNFLHSQLTQWNRCLDGENRTLFIEQVCLRFYHVLLKHFSQYPVSMGLGGMKLLRDITEYKEFIDTLGFEKITTKFNTLRSLANIFVVSSDDLGELLRQDPYLNKLPRSLLVSYLQQHVDFKKSWLETVFA